LVLDVALDGTASTKETVVAVGSHVGVTGQGSASVVVAVGVEVFFDIDDIGFLEVLFVVSTLVLEGGAEGDEA